MGFPRSLELSGEKNLLPLLRVRERCIRGTVCVSRDLLGTCQWRKLSLCFHWESVMSITNTCFECW